ncbi:glycosyltransferase family 2 protein [Eubacterium maltosivorans]|uniref:Glycosyltransferase family 2 protein n=1 Tax=Eubacterium maltosivorans TaxID=2041044 RepID=A0A2A5TCI2_EUBML|nr:glycosyltransferase family 2 protein [Eubacterium maltosivorans]
MIKVLVIVPAYNEQDSIESVIENLKEITIPNIKLDYVIINDCSIDNTKKICLEKNYNFIDLPVNLGIGGGVQTGYKYAVEQDYDIAIQMDGDGQHDPFFIKNLIEPIINNQADMVIGSRFITKEGFQSSGARRIGINMLRILIKSLSGKEIKDTTSGFRATNKALTTFFSMYYASDYPEPEAIIAATLNNFTIKEVSVVMSERKGGESSIKAFKSVYYMIKVFLAIIICRLGSFRKGK